MNRLPRMVTHAVHRSLRHPVACTLLAVPVLTYTAMPVRTQWFGLGGGNSTESNVDVEIDDNNVHGQPIAPGSSQSAAARRDPRVRQQSELDDLLDQLFGRDSSNFDPIEQISKNVPKMLWPAFFVDMVEDRKHRRFSRQQDGGSSGEKYVGGSGDPTGQLLNWLNSLAPGHSNWWSWADEISKPFALHLEDKGNEYGMRVSLKDLSKDDVKVRVQDNVLTVIGAKRQQSNDAGDMYQSSSRSLSALQQSIRLPGDADKSRLKAKYTDGALLITIPKSVNYSKDADIRIE